MFYICGALLFAFLGSRAVAMNDDSPDRVNTYLKTRTDIIIRKDPLFLKDIQKISLINVKRFVFKVADPEELLEITARLIQSPQLKAVITVEGEIDVGLKKLIEYQDVRKQITLQFCEPQPREPMPDIPLSIELHASLTEIPQQLFEYTNLESKLGPEIRERIMRLRGVSDDTLRRAREDALNEIFLIGSGNKRSELKDDYVVSVFCDRRDLSLENVKARVLRIYDRYLGIQSKAAQK